MIWYYRMGMKCDWLWKKGARLWMKWARCLVNWAYPMINCVWLRISRVQLCIKLFERTDIGAGRFVNREHQRGIGGCYDRPGCRWKPITIVHCWFAMWYIGHYNWNNLILHLVWAGVELSQSSGELAGIFYEAINQPSLKIIVWEINLLAPRRG